MENVTLNFTQSDVLDLLSKVSDGEYHEVFKWSMTSEDGNTIEIKIVVNDIED